MSLNPFIPADLSQPLVSHNVSHNPSLRSFKRRAALGLMTLCLLGGLAPSLQAQPIHSTFAKETRMSLAPNLGAPAVPSSDQSATTPAAVPMPVPAALDWSAENKAKIEAFFQASDLKGKVAVFDADDTLWRHDVGEGFLKFLQEKGKLAMVPDGFDAFGRYQALCAQNKWMGYPYAAQVMAGMAESDVRALAHAYFEQNFQQNVYPGQQALIRRLEEAGVEVYIVSASNQWIVEAGAPHLGVAADHVIGVRLEVVKGQVTANIIPPMTFRQGKADAIKQYIGQQPVLVAGDSMTDYEMLKYASRLRLVINPKDAGSLDENLFKLATQQKWSIQKW